MENIQEIHEKIYAHLIARSKKDSSLRFTTRQTNRYSRLDKGYWFHGNDNYLVISFWSGTDWMNKTPNIMFSTDFEECYLEISVWDSSVKRTFVDEYLVPNIKDLNPGGKYYKYLGSLVAEDKTYEEDIITILDRFLAEDKSIIDRLVSENSAFLNEDDNRIGFIDEGHFNWTKDKIEEYRRRVQKEPYTIRSLKIRSFGEIKDCIFDDIPPRNQCIFLTGENGTGKSTILKAIGAALVNDHHRMKEDDRMKNYPSYDVELGLGKHDGEGKDRLVIEFNTLNKGESKYLSQEGYAAYGPYRLMTQETHHPDTSVRNPNMGNDSLFNTDMPLIDIKTGLNVNRVMEEDIDRERCKGIIEEAMADIVPRFNGIIWGEENEPIRFKIGYPGDPGMDVSEPNSYSFDELATGARSVLGMIGDMMVRLFKLQSTVDVGELKGIVLIDEIDIHLHPTFQKLLVEQLTATFPKVQFVISTHSPVPLLGAPEKSVFFVVKKDYERSTYVERIDDVHIKNLTPDTILTSPIFGMQDILHADYGYDYDHPSKNLAFTNIRTESTWDGVKIADAEFQTLLRKYQQRKGGVNG